MDSAQIVTIVVSTKQYITRERYTLFAFATQNHPIILHNSVIIIMRYLMAQRSDEGGKRIKSRLKGKSPVQYRTLSITD